MRPCMSLSWALILQGGLVGILLIGIPLEDNNFGQASTAIGLVSKIFTTTGVARFETALTNVKFKSRILASAGLSIQVIRSNPQGTGNSLCTTCPGSSACSAPPGSSVRTNGSSGNSVCVDATGISACEDSACS